MLASRFRLKKSPSKKKWPNTLLKTRFPFLYVSTGLDTRTWTITSNRNFESSMSIRCLAPQHLFRFFHLCRGFFLCLWQLCSLFCRLPQRSTERSRWKKDTCLQWVTFPEKSRSVVDPRRSRCPIGLRFQEASNLLAWHELFANLYELTSRILVLGGIQPLWANMKGIWIWPIFVKFRQNIRGIMTNESVSENFDIWNTQHDSHIFSYINFRCRYLDNQSKYRKKLDTLLLIDALWMRLCSQFARAASSDTR